jgi:hypothetical protein
LNNLAKDVHGAKSKAHLKKLKAEMHKIEIEIQMPEGG